LIKSWVSWGSVIKAPKIPEGYLERFEEAEFAFLHQRVYDSCSKTLVPLNPFPDGLELSKTLSNLIGP
jgi:hypothetical protein